MKHFRPFFGAALFLACALAAQVTRAAGCPDDPERCVQRGSAVARTSGTVALSPAVTVSAVPAMSTPGMGMLLKLSAGAPGEVSWFPSRPADNSGASWVL